MGVSLCLCLPRVRSVAPSRAFPQARLDYLASLCHVFCVFAYVSGPLLHVPEEVYRRPPAQTSSHFNLFLRSVALEGFGLVARILRFGILCI